jgi:hypothetical protein
MKNLNRWEIANHLHTSAKETYPSEREIPLPASRGGKRTSAGEFSAREQVNPHGHLRDDRSFTQSLWGRR